MGKKVIIAENESIIELDIQYLLEDMGFSVPAVALSVEDAIAKTKKLIPDLLILDTELPSGEVGDDGIDAIRKIHQNINMPVIFLTSLKDSKTLKRMEEIKYSKYLCKPFSNEDLTAAVENLINVPEAALMN